MSGVKYHESHYDTVLDMYVNFRIVSTHFASQTTWNKRREMISERHVTFSNDGLTVVAVVS